MNEAFRIRPNVEVRFVPLVQHDHEGCSVKWFLTEQTKARYGSWELIDILISLVGTERSCWLLATRAKAPA